MMMLIHLLAGYDGGVEWFEGRLTCLARLNNTYSKRWTLNRPRSSGAWCVVPFGSLSRPSLDMTRVRLGNDRPDRPRPAPCPAVVYFVEYIFVSTSTAQ